MYGADNAQGLIGGKNGLKYVLRPFQGTLDEDSVGLLDRALWLNDSHLNSPLAQRFLQEYGPLVSNINKTLITAIMPFASYSVLDELLQLHNQHHIGNLTGEEVAELRNQKRPPS